MTRLWPLVCSPAQPSPAQPSPARVGIPIGNLTSQFFANIYLSGLDHFIQKALRCRHYVRYMDDFVVFHGDKECLWIVKAAVVDYLKNLRLTLHDGKCRIFETRQGVPFLGQIIFPDRKRLRRENVIRFRRRCQRFLRLYQGGEVNLKNIRQSICAWIGHARQADTIQLRNLLSEDIVF